MARYQIVLADQDEDYISLLELRFLEYFGDVADIQLISDPAYFRSYFETPKKLDLLIINDALYLPELTRHSIEAIIRLSEVPVETCWEKSGCILYKYTGMKILFDELAPYLDRAASCGAQRQETRLVCVYSPVGGIGSTTLSLGLCAALVKLNRKVLYLNTETIQSFPSLLPQQPPTMDAQCRNQLLREVNGTELPGQEAFGHCGFDYLLPFENSPTSYGITLTHLIKLAQDLQQSNRYHCIILDCSSEFTQEKSVLMSACSTVLILLSQEQQACRRIESLLRNINIRDGEKFQFVCCRYREDEENYLKESLLGKINLAEYIPYLPAHLRSRVDEIGSQEAVMRLAYRLV